jgi:hypothetical protein
MESGDRIVAWLLVGVVRTFLSGDHLSRYPLHATRKIRAESFFYLRDVCCCVVARLLYALCQFRPAFGDAVKVPLESQRGAVKLHFSDERLTVPNRANAPMQRSVGPATALFHASLLQIGRRQGPNLHSGFYAAR